MCCTETRFICGTGRLLSVRPPERLLRTRWMNSRASYDSILELMNDGHIPLDRIRGLKDFYSKMKGDYCRDLAAEFSTRDAVNKAADDKFIDKVLVLTRQASMKETSTCPDRRRIDAQRFRINTKTNTSTLVRRYRSEWERGE